MADLSLFEFMLKLRANPRLLGDYFADLNAKVLEAEPRNLARELKGSPMEMTSFIAVYGFGDPLSHVVGVAFHPAIDPLVAPEWEADHENLIKLFGITPIVLALATEEAAEQAPGLLHRRLPKPSPPPPKRGRNDRN